MNERKYLAENEKPEGEGVNAAANEKALADALRTGLFFFKAIIVALAAFFLFSGLYWVEEGTIALHERFGRVIESGVASPGGPYFAFPEPMDKVMVIPTTMQEVTVDEGFWYSENASRGRFAGLEPGVDGSLITGDKNLVHGKWNVTYKLDYDRDEPDRIGGVMDFHMNVGTMGRANALVAAETERAIVHQVSGSVVDDFVLGRINNAEIHRRLQRQLDELGSGLRVTAVSLKTYSPPKMLRYDFEAVTRAESEKALKIEEAEKYTAKLMNGAAGPAHGEILKLVERFENARARGLDEDAETIENEIFKALESPLAGGEVAALINEARGYRTEKTETMHAMGRRFAKLLEHETENSDILRERMLQELIDEVLVKSDSSKMVVPAERGKSILIDLGRGAGKMNHLIEEIFKEVKGPNIDPDYDK